MVLAMGYTADVMDMTFLEIEHKYLIDDQFDLNGFRQRVRELEPKDQTSVAVRDIYYFNYDQPEFVMRHRYDREIQQLTIKGREADPEARTEINLNLGHSSGDQAAAVKTFVGMLGFRDCAEVHKDVEVYYFADCEVVNYRANCGDRRVHCIEVEAKGADSKESGIAILKRYEDMLNLTHMKREKKSLFELLVL